MPGLMLGLTDILLARIRQSRSRGAGGPVIATRSQPRRPAPDATVLWLKIWLLYFALITFLRKQEVPTYVCRDFT